MTNAADKILEYIAHSGLKTGDKILPERKLARALALSRASLREAIRSLSVTGILEARIGDGTYIRNKPMFPMVTTPDFADFAENPQYGFDVMEMRRALEANAAYDAALNATPDGRAKITAAFNQLSSAQSLKDPLLQAKYDAEFHLAIVQASNNKVLYFIYQQLFEILQNSIGNFLQNLYPNEGEGNLFAQHQAIYNAIIAHDPDAAKDAALAHTQSIIKTLHQAYEE